MASNGHTDWQVQVTDTQAAEAQLPSLVLADGRVMLMDFGRRQSTLEDIFMTMVTGDNHGS